MSWIWLIIGGFIIGGLGKLVAPGDKDNIPIWATLICGIGGVLIGNVIYQAFGGDGSPGIDWTRWVVAVICSAGLVVGASSVLGRRKVAR
ncbi:MAG: GlsB/YeaQ/YmgE family stress response membrane protein [Nocardioidaceae bacterium]